uniref:RNA-directed DNA polymerase n=1 Tax=Strongyloides stercoralis TaxID=6248 RepID=A0A0K0EAB8_STRER
MAKIIQSLRKFTYASVIDLHQGFFQIKLNPTNNETFNFKVGPTTYSYARLPQGCINSPIIFQRSIELLFAEFREKTTHNHFQLEIYQDDIILLTSKDTEHHLKILEEILIILHEKDAKLSVTKSKFLKKEIEYLSWKFDGDKVSPSESSITKIIDSKIPKKKKQLYSIIQAANYFQTAIPKWEKLTRPLYKLTRGNLNDNIEWEGQEHLFQQLMNSLLTIPPLKLMDTSKPLILVVDASNDAVGGYLYQENGKNRHILGHFCNVLGPTIKGRSPSYLELKSIAVGVEKFKNIIAGRTLYVQSDHKPLSTLMNSKSVTQPKHFELISSINQYAKEIKYLPGKENSLADYLSRPENTANISQCYTILTNTSEEIDNMKQAIISDQNDLDEHDIVLQHIKFKKGRDDILRIPLRKEETILKLIKKYHEKYAHISANKMEELIKRRYQITNLNSYINNYLKNCSICQKLKDDGCFRPELKTINYPESTWEIVASDILIIPTHGRVIQFICTLSRFWVPVLLENLTSQHTIHIAIQEVFSRFGFPKKLILDQGTNYKNIDMAKFCEKFNIQLHYCTADHKSGNSIAERSFRTMRSILMKLKHSTDQNSMFDLNLAIHYAAFIYNISINDTTRTSPFQMMFGREPNNIDIIGMEIGITENLTMEKLKILRSSARTTSEILRNKQNKKLNENRGDDNLTEGDQVFIKSHPANKLEAPFQGPYIVKKITEDTCHLNIQGKKGRPLIRNKTQLKLFILKIEE